MENKRLVYNLMSVFDLSDYEGLGKPENTYGRVMLIYDKEKNVKEFKLLKGGIPAEMQRNIISWLEKNIEIVAEY